jgi:hypothetical protein
MAWTIGLSIWAVLVVFGIYRLNTTLKNGVSTIAGRLDHMHQLIALVADENKARLPEDPEKATDRLEWIAEHLHEIKLEIQSLSKNTSAERTTDAMMSTAQDATIIQDTLTDIGNNIEEISSRLAERFPTVAESEIEDAEALYNALQRKP